METYMITVLYFLTAIIWIWALVDLMKSRFPKVITKALWLFVISFFPILGSIFYFQFGRLHKISARRKFQPGFGRTHNRSKAIIG